MLSYTRRQDKPMVQIRLALSPQKKRRGAHQAARKAKYQTLQAKNRIRTVFWTSHHWKNGTGQVNTDAKRRSLSKKADLSEEEHCKNLTE